MFIFFLSDGRTYNTIAYAKPIGVRETSYSSVLPYRDVPVK